MKLYIPLYMLTFLICTADAQIEFETKYIDDFYRGTYDFRLHDVDLDGDLDIVSHTPAHLKSEERLSYYKNQSGNFELNYFDFDLVHEVKSPYYNSYVGDDNLLDFFSKSGDQLILIDQSASGVTTNVLFEEEETQEAQNAFAIGDFNGDDLLDHLVFKYPDLTLAQFNQTNSGSYERYDYSINLRYINDYADSFYYEVIDLNNDGFDDLVFAGYDQQSSTTKLILYKSSGETFEEILLSDKVNDHLFSSHQQPIQFKDHNNDGLLDFVILEQGEWSEHPLMLFTQNISGDFNVSAVGVNYDKASYKVFMYDHDLDGDLDVAHLVTGGSDSYLYWRENIGGTYQANEVVSFHSYETVDLLLAANMNDDNHFEFISSSGFLKYSSFENNHKPVHINEKLVGVSEIESADIDQDGDTDLLIAGLYNPVAVLYEYIGTEYKALQTFIDFDKVRKYQFLDLNGDNHKDLLFVRYQASNTLAIEQWLNNGSNEYSLNDTQVLASSLTYGKFNIEDIDNNGDQDLLIVRESSAVWFQNNSGVFTNEKIIIDRFTYSHDEKFALSDFDGDSDLDLVIATRSCIGFSCNGEETRLFEFNETVGDFESSQLIREEMLSVNGMDLNNDRVSELLYYSPSDSERGIYDFTQSILNPVKTGIDIGIRGPFVDHNQDGLLDYLGYSSSKYYKNIGSFEFVEEPYSLDHLEGIIIYFEGKAIGIGDYNKDGLTDFLTQYADEGELVMNLQTNRGTASAVPVPFNLMTWIVSIFLVVAFSYVNFRKNRKGTTQKGSPFM